MNVPKDIGFSSGSLSPAIAIKGRKAHKSMVRILLFIIIVLCSPIPSGKLLNVRT